VLAGMREGSKPDRSLSTVSILSTATPEYVSGVIPVAVFSSSAVGLKWFKSTATSAMDDIARANFTLPVLTIALYGMGYIAHMTRASMTEVMTAQYIRTARLKGVAFRTIVIKHALRNALIAPFTVIMLQIPWLLNGVVIVETPVDFLPAWLDLFDLDLDLDLDPGLLVVFVSVVFVNSPTVFRIVRGLTMDIKTRDYAAAQTRGEGAWYIMLWEILPNARRPLIVDFACASRNTAILLGTPGFSGPGLGSENRNRAQAVVDLSAPGPAGGDRRKIARSRAYSGKLSASTFGWPTTTYRYRHGADVQARPADPGNLRQAVCDV
jgi:ABC-type dipeptide/oligopeptide/nickel transport system permease component